MTIIFLTKKIILLFPGVPSNLAEAASKVASQVGGEDKQKVMKTQSELLKQLQKTSEAMTTKSADISSLMGSMKV